MTHGIQGLPWRVRACCWFACILAAIVAANVATFAATVANPLIYSDNWTFVDTFLRIAIEDGPGFGDFLVKRAGLDHAQPLNKLLMWWNYRWFGLDFTFESRVAILCALAGCVLLAGIVVRERAVAAAGIVRVDGSGACVVGLLLAAIAGVQLSLNSIDVYAYPMVTMAHAFYLLAFLTIHAAWLALRGGTLWWLGLTVSASGIVGDDSAILLGAAIALAACLFGWRTGRWSRSIQVVVVIVVVLLACRGIYVVFGEVRGATNPDFNVPAARRVAELMAQWQDAWKWIAVPFSAGIAAAGALKAAFGESWLTARMLLATVVLLAHAWFWRSARRAEVGATWFLAIGVMLMFYAHIAGILLGRVFVRGPDFLEQTRYVVFYQLGIVALLLMAIAATGVSASRLQRSCATIAALALLMLQVPLTISAWRYADAYQARYVAMARDMGAMARDPRHPPPHCTRGVDICVRPEATRITLMELLVRHEVNLFSPRFRASHPRLSVAAGPVDPPMVDSSPPDAQ